MSLVASAARIGAATPVSFLVLGQFPVVLGPLCRIVLLTATSRGTVWSWLGFGCWSSSSGRRSTLLVVSDRRSLSVLTRSPEVLLPSFWVILGRGTRTLLPLTLLLLISLLVLVKIHKNYLCIVLCPSLSVILLLLSRLSRVLSIVSLLSVALALIRISTATWWRGRNRRSWWCWPANFFLTKVSQKCLKVENQTWISFCAVAICCWLPRMVKYFQSGWSWGGVLLIWTKAPDFSLIWLIVSPREKF